MTIVEQFDQVLAPFFWVEQGQGAAVCLDDQDYLQDVFRTRAAEGFTGGGSDWISLAQVFLAERCPDLVGKVSIDSESSMFCAFSKDKEALADFILGFRRACDDRDMMVDLFSRVQRT